MTMDLDFYRRFCEARAKGNYVIDGALDEAKWSSVSPKILFVLKETVGYKDCPIFHMRDEIPLWLRKSRTYPPIGRLAVALHAAFPKRRPLNSQEFKELDFSVGNLFTALEKCAVIDLKKHSGVSIRSDNRDIKREFAANKELLQKQIDSLNPDIIVAGSTVCWECLTDKTLGIFQNINGLAAIKKHNCGVFNGKLFYHANHPSAPGNGRFYVEKIHNQIMERLGNTDPGL